MLAEQRRLRRMQRLEKVRAIAVHADLVGFLCQPARSTVALEPSIAALAKLLGHAS